MPTKKKPSSKKHKQEKKQPTNKKPSHQEKKPERYHDIYEDDKNTHGVYESEEDYW